jgi:hypothetical protein
LDSSNIRRCPTRSTGALTVLQLAAEAGVKRWVLTHKHPDLRKVFEEQRRAASGVPAAYHHLHGQIADLHAGNQRLRNENADLAERVDIYAQVIRELTTTLETLRTHPPRRDHIRRPSALLTWSELFRVTAGDVG